MYSLRFQNAGLERAGIDAIFVVINRVIQFERPRQPLYFQGGSTACFLYGYSCVHPISVAERGGAVLCPAPPCYNCRRNQINLKLTDKLPRFIGDP